MAAAAINGFGEPGKSFVLRILDALAEWLMRQELRIISRARKSHRC